jgi:hypothetical protein
MYSPPTDPEDKSRMHAAFDRCAVALGVKEVTGRDSWGWHGRTLSRRAWHPVHGWCWLRLMVAPADKAHGKLWEGNSEAQRLFGGRVAKPTLFDQAEEAEDENAYRAELSEFITEPVCSAGPVLQGDPDMPSSWWASLCADLATVASAATDRVAVRQEWVDRTVPRFLGIDPPEITHWETAHGDLHPANLTGGTPYILDWEGFGRAPVGYDAAMLLGYSLLSPNFAGHVRRTFPVLDTDNGRVAQIIVITELLQAASRGDYPELVPRLRALAVELA